MPHPRSRVCSSRTRQAAYSHVHTLFQSSPPSWQQDAFDPIRPHARAPCRWSLAAAGQWMRAGLPGGRSCAPPSCTTRLYTFTQLYLILSYLQCWDCLRGAFDTMSCGSGLCRRPAPFPAHHQHDGPQVHAERVCWAALPRAMSVSLTCMSCSFTGFSFGDTADLMTRIVFIVPHLHSRPAMTHWR